ncbi:hypothetical protein [Streptomyces prasinus]|uniref:hypothetical protein n=1 Tax=Streptomyces prasinus TaxID=67345 RepID=UPI0037F7227D
MLLAVEGGDPAVRQLPRSRGSGRWAELGQFGDLGHGGRAEGEGRVGGAPVGLGEETNQVAAGGRMVLGWLAFVAQAAVSEALAGTLKANYAALQEAFSVGCHRGRAGW